MDLSGQPHALATLPLADKAPLPIEHEAGWVQELVRMFWRRNFLFLLGIEPWIVQPIAWSLHQLCYTSLCSYRQINVSNMLAVCISSSITITNCIYQNVELAIFHNSSFLNRRFTLQSHTNLTLTLLMWRIWWAPNNASRWQIGFNLAFKGLKMLHAGIFLKIGDYEGSSICKAILYSGKLNMLCHTRARVAQCV